MSDADFDMFAQLVGLNDDAAKDGRKAETRQENAAMDDVLAMYGIEASADDAKQPAQVRCPTVEEPARRVDDSRGPVQTAPDSAFDGSPIEDDGTVELALMATEHREIRRFGEVIFEHMRTVNGLMKQCTGWIQKGEFPALPTSETYQLVQVAMESLRKDVGRLESIDLHDIKPGWCGKVPKVGADLTVVKMISYKFPKNPLKNYDLKVGLKGIVKQVDEKGDAYVTWEGEGNKWLLNKDMDKISVDERADSVKMARRSILDFADILIKRLDCLKDRLEGPAIQMQHQIETAPDNTDSGAADENTPAKRARISPLGQEARVDVDAEALLRKLEAKTGRPLQIQPLSALRQQLVSLVAVPDFGATPDLCRDAIECCLKTVKVVLDKKPAFDVRTRLSKTLQGIEGLTNPDGLSKILVELVNVVADV